VSKPHVVVAIAVLAVAVVAPACSFESNEDAERPKSMATTEWMHHVGQICGWARPQARRLMRSARRVRTIDDATEWVEEMTGLSARMNAVFRRLPPPRDRARERNRILRLMHLEDQVGEDLRQALHESRGKAFFHLAVQMEKIDRRIAVILDDLGIVACQPGARPAPLRGRDLAA